MTVCSASARYFAAAASFPTFDARHVKCLWGLEELRTGLDDETSVSFSNGDPTDGGGDESDESPDSVVGGRQSGWQSRGSPLRGRSLPCQ